MINPIDLTSKHILITGASQGIGRDLSILLSQLGAKVSLIARNEVKLNETIAMLKGCHHKIFPHDLKDINGIEGLIKMVVKINGPINGLVHCAGIATMMPLSMTKNDFLHDVMSINFYAFVELVRCASKKSNFVEGASFVGISSVASKSGVKSKIAYCASKAAMDAATRCMAKELKQKNIRVNTVLGGFVKTDIFDEYANNAGDDSAESHVFDKQYMGIGETRDISSAVAYLLSDASKFITGTGLVVDGGYLS